MYFLLSKCIKACLNIQDIREAPIRWQDYTVCFLSGMVEALGKLGKCPGCQTTMGVLHHDAVIHSLTCLGT